jgi:RNA ligase (TIGR02306 family)
MKNKLAFIGKIVEIYPIDGADFVESAVVVCGPGGKWMGTVQKGKHLPGTMVEVYLQDAIVPDTEDFAFMKQHKFRVKMRRFKKVASECLIMPLTVAGHIGDDISHMKNIMKYVKELPPGLAGIALGNFPTNLMPKTDEPNYQGVRWMVAALQGQKYCATVKVDGSSGTIYKTADHFGCCSRNLELKRNENTAIWKIAIDHRLEERMPEGYAMQMEICGPGIQKNRMGYPKIQPKVFNVWNINERHFLDFDDTMFFSDHMEIPTVDWVIHDEIFNIDNDDVLRKMAEGKYESNRQREGIVIRPMKEQKVRGERLSFKVINLLYKD